MQVCDKGEGVHAPLTLSPDPYTRVYTPMSRPLRQRVLLQGAARALSGLCTSDPHTCTPHTWRNHVPPPLHQDWSPQNAV